MNLLTMEKRKKPFYGSKDRQREAIWMSEKPFYY
jgi:hypothetical protein